MILTCISFAIITVICFLAGFFVRRIAEQVFGYRIADPVSVIVSGIVFSAVYAEIFSLFSGVSLGALLILTGFGTGVFIALRKEIISYCKGLYESDGFSGSMILLLILTAIVASVASTEPSDYDTYLYHAQAIKWIETFGAVKGLGNLHLRFGYNSAFLCLQALFSFSFLGRSFHEMNGYICLLMLSYALSGILRVVSDPDGRIKKWTDGSVLIRGTMIFYIVYNLGSISSPGTDLFPMLMLLYIFSRWIEIGCIFPGDDKAVPCGLLCLAAVLILTAKLSVAPVILLALYPFSVLLRRKEGKQLAAFVLTAVLIGTPYLIRNVILTGYLVYPMEKIDLFQVDWKVPKAMAAADRQEIGVYAKALQTPPKGDYGFRQWVQIWFRDLELIPRILLFISGFLILAGIVRCIKTLVRKSAGDREFLFTVSLILYLYWFFLGPNMRFGIVNLVLISSLTLRLLENEEGSRIWFCLTGLLTLAVFAGKADTALYTHTNLVYPDDYKRFECEEVFYRTPSGDQKIIYVPKNGDQSGVDVFPESPVANGDYQELRGEELKEGFRSYAF